jgi:hypothetical protein
MGGLLAEVDLLWMIEPVVSQANLKDFSTKALMEISASKLE